MSIAFDAHASDDSSGSVSSLSYSHICTGSNLLLLVNVNVNSASDLVTGVTYNSVALTLVNKVINGAQGSNYIYALLSPATGSHSIAISLSSSSGISARSSSFTGVSQSGFPDAQKTANSSSAASTFSTSITTVANNSWIYAAASSDHGVLSAGTNMTLRDAGTATNIAEFDTNGAITPAGSTTVGFASTSGSSDWTVNVASFAPASAGSPVIHSLSSLGVGA